MLKYIFVANNYGMGILKIILLSVTLLALAVFGFATRLIFKKDGKFPNTHVSGNKHLRQQGITCVQTYDRQEQKKAKQEINYKNLTLNK